MFHQSEQHTALNDYDSLGFNATLLNSTQASTTDNHSYEVFFIVRSCEMVAFILIIIATYLLHRQLKRLKEKHELSLSESVVFFTFCVFGISIFQQLWNILLSWIFVIIPIKKSNDVSKDVCMVRTEINYILTAFYHFVLYIYFINRFLKVFKNTIFEYNKYVIYCLYFSMSLYVIIYLLLNEIFGHIAHWYTFNNGIDCFGFSDDWSLWAIGIYDTFLTILVTLLFVLKIFQVNQFYIKTETETIRKTMSVRNGTYMHGYGDNLRKFSTTSTATGTGMTNDNNLNNNSNYLNTSLSTINSTRNITSKYTSRKGKTNSSKTSVSVSVSFVFENCDSHESLKESILQNWYTGIKIMILCAISILSTWFFFYIGFSSLFYDAGWFVPFDPAINAFCVLLSFAHNDRIFSLLCMDPLARLCTSLCPCYFCKHWGCVMLCNYYRRKRGKKKNNSSINSNKNDKKWRNILNCSCCDEGHQRLTVALLNKQHFQMLEPISPESHPLKT